MIIYVSHIFQGKQENLERAKKITHDLQVKDIANCYICPLTAFSYLEYGEIGYDDEMELCLDLLTCADRMIVASEISKGVQMEIDFAKLVKMEVMQIDKFGELQPFTE
jgi:ketopantoate reductase